ncbi:anti-sigma-K factor RskA [Catenulispora sp. GAS73]
MAVLGVQAGDQQHQLDQAHQQSTGITALLAAPDARTDTANVRTGGVGTVLVSRSHDAAAITVDGLAKLPPGKAYQLWMIGPSGTRSGGLLATGADGSSGPVLAHGLGDAQTIGLTVEPAGGSVQPTTTPVMLLPMPA